jgi:mRNA-degrading endonuclease HigB of HigAB toxin-antitoxin module
MRVIGKKRHIDPLIVHTPGSIEARDLMQWYKRVKSESWQGPADLEVCHPAALRVGSNRWRFPLKRSGLNVIAKVNMDGADGLVLIEGIEGI